MNILFITPFNIFPPYWGGGQRSYHLVKHLAKNHKVYLISPAYKQFRSVEKEISEYYKKELKKLGVRVYTVSNWFKFQVIEHTNPLILMKCLRIIVHEHIDLVICDYPWSGVYAILCKLLSQKPFILIEHNIEYLLKEEVKARYVFLMKSLELMLCKHAEYVVTVSKKDKETLIRLGIDGCKIRVMENGFDSSRFFPNNKVRERIRRKLGVGDKPLLFFCGKLDYAPNVEAVYNIYWKVMPRVLEKVPEAKFIIVGSGMNGHDFNFGSDSLIFVGAVDNIQDYLNASDVVLCPLTKGGGTRIKILEAIACGKKVVSTSKGAEGLENELTRPFLRIADDWEAFGDEVVKLLLDPDREEVPEKFINRFSWSNVYKKMDELLEMVR